jgi:PST family polysaccharide transporter
MGGGTSALVTQALTYSVLLSVLRVAASRWYPGRPSRAAPMGALLRYAINLMGTQVLGYASRNIDSVIVGARFGSVPLGVYNRAYQLLTAPINQISAPLTKVALPVFSRLAPESSKFNSALLRTQCVLAYAFAILFAMLITDADSLVLLLFGDQWGAVPLIFRILAVGGVFQIFTYTSYWVFLAKGLTNWNLRYALVSRTIVIAAIFIGSIWGYIGVAAGYTIAMIICWPLCQWWIGRKVALPQKALLAVGLRALAVGSGGALLGMATMRVVPDPGVLALFVGVFGTLAGAAIVAMVHRSFRSDVQTLFGSAQLIYRRS